MTTQRDAYNAIVFRTLDSVDQNAIRDLVNAASTADKIDEHGGWDFGIEKLTRKRSRALNWDLYGYGHDCHSGQLLAVIQVREWTEGNRFNTVRKSYFLLGRNEDQTTFAHPVSANVVHAAIRRDADVVQSVQNWIFGGNYCAMIRHGDLALIPLATRPARTKGQLRKTAVLEGSHELRATQIADVDGRIYAKNPALRHLPGVHPDVAATGWHRVIVGKRASYWNFAAPTID